MQPGVDVAESPPISRQCLLFTVELVVSPTLKRFRPISHKELNWRARRALHLGILQGNQMTCNRAEEACWTACWTFLARKLIKEWVPRPSLASPCDGGPASRGLSDRVVRRWASRSCEWKVCHLMVTSNLPVFKLGSMICARKSVLVKWVKDKEQRCR